MDLNTFLSAAKESVSSNILLQGGIFITIFSMVFGYLKELPGKFYAFVKARFTVELTIYEDNNFYLWTMYWLSNQSFIRRSKRLFPDIRMKDDNSISDHDNKLYDICLAPGKGIHFFIYKKKLCLLNISVKDSEKTQQRRYELTLTMFSHNNKICQNFLNEVYEFWSRDKADTVSIFMDQYGYWHERNNIDKRSLVSIYLNFKHEIIDDLKKFFASRERYKQLGVPYRRGYLFYGKPGVGKSSFLLALASYFDMPIYYLNLSSVPSDNECIRLLTEVPRNAFLVIEDIDTVSVSEERKKTLCDKNDEDGESNKAIKTITLSGLLNAIDGIVAGDGRVLILTTNHPEKLDAALVRNGRIDRSWEFGYADTKEIQEIFESFFSKNGAAEFAEIVGNKTQPMCKIQEFLLVHMQKNSNIEDVLIAAKDTFSSKNLCPQ